MSSPDNLTPKQRRFVAEYLVSLNATQAAIRAGYSPKSAPMIGSENLRKPNIAAAIEAEQARFRGEIKVTQSAVLRRLVREADREDEGSTHAARVNAIGLLGKHLGMFVEKRELTASAELLQAARAICEAMRPITPGMFANDPRFQIEVQPRPYEDAEVVEEGPDGA